MDGDGLCPRLLPRRETVLDGLPLGGFEGSENGGNSDDPRGDETVEIVS